VTGDEAFNFFMALHYPADNLVIMDYNRVLKELNGMNNDQFLERLGEHFDITPIEEVDKKPKAIHTLSLFINQTWFNLALKPASLDTSSPVTVIDSHMLTELVLKPILGIEDIKKDPRIDFVGGIRGLQELEKRCSEDCVAAFAMFPVQMEELLNVADAGLIMPPKSTWFEPKPRSGFVLRCFKD
jgi:uncharacterized protein (DUF1015 family)